MYILLNNNIVKEIIPDINSDLPGVPIEKRYPAAFVAELIHADDSADIRQGYVYDPETGVFAEPEEPEYVEPEIVPEEDPIEEEPTQLDRIEAQVTYTAMMTDTLLEV